jgi:drug/metabolite transporter (DMT)-like permease
MPGVFVLLWSTGFIGAKFGLPYAEPMTFLVLRFAIVTVLLCVFAGLSGAPWPKSWGEAGHIAVAGLLLQAVYLGGVFASIHHGVPAGISALIVGIQPLLVAASAGPVLGERVTARQWLGLVLGLGGVVLVVWTKLDLGVGTLWGYALSVIALVGITVGTLYQKRFCPAIDLRSGTAIQFAATTVALAPLALLFETRQVTWSGEFVFALGWLCIVLSLGAITLLFILIRRGAAARVSSLFFLVPPCTALVAWPLFGEQLSPLALAGMAATMAGVALVNIAPKS